MTALGLAAVALSCATRDVDPRPFRLEARRESGASLADGLTQRTFFALLGTARVVDATTLRVEGTAEGTITLTFDPTAAPKLAFPARLEGTAVEATIFADPAGLGPRKEPLRIPGFRIATDLGNGAFTYEFLVGEWTEPGTAGAPAVPPSLQKVMGTEDIPDLDVAAEWVEYEPAECGLVYYAPLVVQGGGSLVNLDRGEQVEVPLARPITVLHVLSYHRRGTCSGQSSAWTQIAAWR